MTALDSSWLKFWEFVSEFGFIMVIVGVIGEGAELVVKWFDRQKGKATPPKKLKWLLPFETVSFLILVVGLAMEFLGSHNAMRIADAENSRLDGLASVANERAAKFELSAKQLEAQIEQTRIKVASQDPYKQPIVALSAIVSFQCLDPFFGILSMEGENGVLGELTLFNRTNKDFPKLVFISNTLKPLVPGDDPAHMKQYFLVFDLSEFRQDMGPSNFRSYSVPVGIVGRNVDFINGFDSLTLKLFIKTNRPPPQPDGIAMNGRMIIGGRAALVANSTLKVFSLSSVTNPTNNPIILTNLPMPSLK